MIQVITIVAAFQLQTDVFEQTPPDSSPDWCRRWFLNFKLLCCTKSQKGEQRIFNNSDTPPYIVHTYVIVLVIGHVYGSVGLLIKI